MSYTMKGNCCCNGGGGLGFNPEPEPPARFYSRHRAGRFYNPPPPIRAYHNGVFGSAGGDSSIRQSFNCDQVWADAQEGGKVGGYYTYLNNQCPPDPKAPDYGMVKAVCDTMPGKISNANYKGGKAADQIRRGLNELGFGPLTLGVAWGGADSAAWEAFTSSHGLPAGPGLVNKAGLCQMQEDLRGGKGVAKAGLSKGLLIALAAAAAVGVGAMALGKKKKGQAASQPPAGFGAA